jgi:maltodextrin utilization protein YvdJ
VPVPECISGQESGDRAAASSATTAQRDGSGRLTDTIDAMDAFTSVDPDNQAIRKVREQSMRLFVATLAVSGVALIVALATLIVGVLALGRP